MRDWRPVFIVVLADLLGLTARSTNYYTSTMLHYQCRHLEIKRKERKRKNTNKRHKRTMNCNVTKKRQKEKRSIGIGKLKNWGRLAFQLDPSGVRYVYKLTYNK
jgi:hypothetical protein